MSCVCGGPLINQSEIRLGDEVHPIIDGTPSFCVYTQTQRQLRREGDGSPLPESPDFTAQFILHSRAGRP